MAGGWGAMAAQTVASFSARSLIDLPSYEMGHTMKVHDNVRLQRGFTLIELMVVVSIIALLLGFSVPLVFKLDELSRDRSGVNTFGVAVTAARAFSARTIADLEASPNAEYSGAAVLVTPMNQLRIIADVQNQGLEDGGYSGFGYDAQTSQMEAISMPRGIGVVGIVRISNNVAQGLKLIPPPFVIRFNRHGQLVAEDRTTSGDPDIQRNVVYIDHDLDGTFSTTPARAAGYDPGPYDPDVTANISGQWNQTARDWQLPFAAMESVVGVIVYSKADFEDAGGRLSTNVAPVQGYPDNVKPANATEAINKWMLANGSVLFFSRNTGNVLRTKGP